MNWINAKDRLPEHDECCFIYIPKKQLFTVAEYLICRDGRKIFKVPSELTCCCGNDWNIEKEQIFWMPIDDIPKPEMK